MRSFFVLSLIGIVGCTDSTPVRIALASDTVVVNTTTVEPLDVRLLNREGAKVSDVPIEYSAPSDSIVAVRDGRAIQCRNDGVAPVTLAAGGVTSTVMVRCEIIDRLEAEPFVCMRLGDAPVPLSVAAMDRNGNRILAPHLYIDTDSSFVRIANGLITPLKAGDGDVGYTNGRRRAVTLVRVLDTVLAGKSKARIIRARDEMFTTSCARLN